LPTVVCSIPYGASSADPLRIEHILVSCPYSLNTWHKVLSCVRSPVSTPAIGVKFADWWDATTYAYPTAGHKGISLVIMLTNRWLIMKEVVISYGTRPLLGGLLDTVNEEAKSWVTVGALALATLLPPT
jgi:hypothetical protein